MRRDTYIRFGRMVLLLVVQLLILNHLHLFGYATPLIIGYMIICCETGLSRMALLWWGFGIGMLYDIFSNTMGMAAASCTLLAMVKPSILKMFMPRDFVGSFKPTIQNMGLSRYIWYSLSCMGLLHFTFYFLEAFSLEDLLLTIGAMFGGTVLATLISVCVEYIVHNRIEEREVGK